jgi:hypothetical protein
VEDNGIVHILDVVFIKKDADGLVTSFEYDGLDEGLEPDSSAALIVWEHRWAARVAQAIRDAGGRIVGGERVPRDRPGGAGRRPAGGVTERGQRCCSDANRLRPRRRDRNLAASWPLTLLP